MNQLDKIEKQFRMLFESGAARFPWTDEGERMTHQFCIAIQDLFLRESPRDLVAASMIEITLHPLTLKAWQSQPDWNAKLSALFKTSAAEFGTFFHTNPDIRMKPDPALLLDEVLIGIRNPQPRPSTETGMLTSQELPPGTSSGNPVLILKADYVVELCKPVINIGRRSSNEIVINDLRISRQHAQIRKVRGEYIIFDISSTGGTFVNSERVEQRTLKSGDVISLAGYKMIFSREQPDHPNTQKGITSKLKSRDEEETN